MRQRAAISTARVPGGFADRRVRGLVPDLLPMGPSVTGLFLANLLLLLL